MGKSQNDLEQLYSGPFVVLPEVPIDELVEWLGRCQIVSIAGEEAVCDVGAAVGAVVGAVVGEAGGRLCPRETHGRPWPCEWVARRHCVKRRGERQCR